MDDSSGAAVRLHSAPERYRDRARSVAVLAAASAGALAAGLAFEAPATILPSESRLAGVTAVGLLLLSLCFYIAALLYSRDRDIDAHEYEKEVREITGAIRRFINWGSTFGVLAVIALFLMLILAVYMPPDSIQSSILFTPQGQAALSEICPEVEGLVTANVSSAVLTEAHSWIELHLDAESCGFEGDQTRLQVPRESVQIIVSEAD